MKNIVKFVLPLVTIMFLFQYCNKPEKVYTDEVNYVHAELTRSGQMIAPNQVANAMSQPPTSPCTWDFDVDGSVSAFDLLMFIQGWITVYDAEDRLDFLSNYGVSYTVDVVPLWSNFIQGSSCNTDWDNFPKYVCNENLLNIPINAIDSIHWIQYGDIVWLDKTELDWQTYSTTCPNGESGGYAPPCNGLQTVSQRIFINGETYYRTNTGWALVDNGPEPCEGGVSDFVGMSYSASDYTHLEFKE